MNEAGKMKRRVAARVSRMTLEECQAWWLCWCEASAAGDLIATGVMTSEMTGCSEPSRSQNIRGIVKRKVYEKMMRLQAPERTTKELNMTVQIKTTRTIKVPGGEIRKVEHTEDKYVRKCKQHGAGHYPVTTISWVLYDADGKYQWTERRLGNAKRRASREYQRPHNPDEVSVEEALVCGTYEVRVGGVLKGTFGNSRRAEKFALTYLANI